MYQEAARKIEAAIKKAQAITIATHLNPDADTIATGLALYHTIRNVYRKPIEIVNVSHDIPLYLDFLPAFDKIKRKSDFENGIVIACDGASEDRFGWDFKNRFVINIDHHASNTHFGHINVVDASMASSAETAYEAIAPVFALSEESAICFYTGMLSDTQRFSLPRVDADTFRRAQMFIEAGADATFIASQLSDRKSLAWLRLLERALRSLRLYHDATVAMMRLDAEDFRATGARMSDTEGIVDYGRNLAVCRISVLLMQLEDGSIRVSFRSKGEDVSKVAAKFGGGGHKEAAGFTLESGDLNEIYDTILNDFKGEKQV